MHPPSNRQDSLYYEMKGNVLFNNALNTFYLQLYGIRHIVKDHSDSEKETRCHHMGYSFRLAARIPLLYQTWSTGWNKKYHHESTMRDRSENPSLPLSFDIY